MNHVLHIINKDLRHTWPYGAAALAVLLVNTANFARVLASRGTEQAAALGVQLPLDWLLAITWALYYGVVLLGDPIPGTRQHWISRPLRWQSLLAAKLLLLPLFALPVAAAHLVQLTLRGFPLSEHAAPVIANAFWLVFAGLLPVAALASLCRNLQQLALWILALAAGVLALQQWDASLPTAIRGVVDDVTAATAILACAAILLWQYATRRTAPARIATVALATVLATLPHWPPSLWLAFILTPNSPATFALAYPITWNTTSLGVAYKVDLLSPKSSIRANEWRIRLSSRSETTTDVRIDNSDWTERSGALDLYPLYDFLSNYGADPWDIEVTGEFTVFSEPRYEYLHSRDERFLPGIGRCQSWVDKLHIIDCQSVLGAAKRLEIAPIRKIGDNSNVNRATPLTSSSEQSPLALIPQLHPIALLSGDLPVNWEKEASSEIRLRTRAPIAHIQRSLQMRSVRLVDHLVPPEFRTNQPQKKEASPPRNILP